jgi:hypothetical protein
MSPLQAYLQEAEKMEAKGAMCGLQVLVYGGCGRMCHVRTCQILYNVT